MSELAAISRRLFDGRDPDLSTPIGGGCISNSYCLRCGEQRIFLKYNPNVPADFFTAEAHGLHHLGATTTLVVPTVLDKGPRHIAMSWIESGSPHTVWADRLGAGLAELHGITRARHGFDHTTYCGATAQDNRPDEDGWAFFGERRLLALGRLMHDRNLVDHEIIKDLERLVGKLRELIPAQPASLLHGDLWTGNVMTDRAGSPCLIDPACYFGWAETDLAMTTMFGSLPARCYEAYTALRPEVRGWESRAPIYNLYHLLNHSLLFAGGYTDQAIRTIRRYA